MKNQESKNQEKSKTKIKSGKFWLKMARANAKWPWALIIVAIALTIIVWCCVGVHYCRRGENNPMGKAFADLVSPVTLRNVAYESNSKIGDSCQVENKVSSVEAEERNILGLSFLFLFGTLVFSGLVIASLTNTMRTWADRFKQGKLWVGKFSGHVVILGYNDMVLGIIQKIFSDEENKFPMILVGVKSDVQGTWYTIRNHTELIRNQRNRIIIFQVDTNCDNHLLKRLQVQCASEVYIVGGQYDADNLKVYRRILEVLDRIRSRKPEFYVHLQSQSILALFRTYTEELEHFHGFNIHDILARQMLMKEEKTICEGVTRVDPDSNKQVHFVIVGMTEMGEALAREAASLCYYSSFVTQGICTKVTFIDKQAEEQKTYLIDRHPDLFEKETIVPKNNFLDVEFEFIKASIVENDIRKSIKDWTNDEKQFLIIAICADSPRCCMEAGLYLPDAVFEHKIPVWIYQSTKSDMIEYLNHPRYNNIITFGMLDDEIDIKTNEIILTN